MITFGCDRCGRTLRREEAWQITLIPQAYAADAAGEKVQGELCGDCAAALLRTLSARNSEKKEQAVERANKKTQEKESGRKNKQESAEQNYEGRCITIARKRMGLTRQELAEKVFLSQQTLMRWEKGMIRKIPWEELERAMPELAEIRKNGCEKYCSAPKACLGGGKCEFDGR